MYLINYKLTYVLYFFLYLRNVVLINNHYTTVSGTLRLVNGDSVKSGRVEVFHNNAWGTVCDDSFGIEDANVICRQLGYPKAQLFGTIMYGAGSGSIWLDDLNCQGDEKFVVNCTHNGWGINNCGHTEDVSVVCEDGTLLSFKYYIRY